jgi:hypothetical protein
VFFARVERWISNRRARSWEEIDGREGAMMVVDAINVDGGVAADGCGNGLRNSMRNRKWRS